MVGGLLEFTAEEVQQPRHQLLVSPMAGVLLIAAYPNLSDAWQYLTLAQSAFVVAEIAMNTMWYAGGEASPSSTCDVDRSVLARPMSDWGFVAEW